MAVYLICLLILTGLTGIHSFELSAKAGDSVTIPCLYDSQHRNHVKYLCKGRSWSSCSTEVRTDSRSSSRKFSISDDKTKRIFPVTIKDLTKQDTDYYWCIVELKGTDTGYYFHLSVTTGTPRLYVDHQEITGYRGEEVSINCRYTIRGIIAWCRQGSSCVRTSSGFIDGTRVTINNSVINVFTVTMSGLRTESSDWYWCGIGDLGMPVHVTVTERPTTLATTTTVSPDPTSIPATGDRPADKNGQDRASIKLNSLFISLSLLISFVMMAVFAWFMLKRRRRTKVESSVTTMDEDEVVYSDVKHTRKSSGLAEEEVTYCNVGYIRKTSSQGSYAESEMDVMYSSVVAIKKQTVKRVEAEDKDVTYSTLAQHHQKI